SSSAPSARLSPPSWKAASSSSIATGLRWTSWLLRFGCPLGIMDLKLADEQAFLPGGIATVDRHHRTRNIAARTAGKEDHRATDFLRLAQAAQRRQRFHLLAVARLAETALGRLGGNPSGRDCVDVDSVRRPFHRQLARQVGQPGLGRRVRRQPIYGAGAL